MLRCWRHFWLALSGIGLPLFLLFFFYVSYVPNLIHVAESRLTAKSSIQHVVWDRPHVSFFPWFGLRFDHIAWEDKTHHYAVAGAVDVKLDPTFLWTDHLLVSGLRFRHWHITYDVQHDQMHSFSRLMKGVAVTFGLVGRSCTRCAVFCCF